MAGSTVSVLVPVHRDSPPASGTRETIERYLATTGFTFEVLVLEEDCYGAAIRRGVASLPQSRALFPDRAFTRAPSSHSPSSSLRIAIAIGYNTTIGRTTSPSFAASR